MISIIIPAFNEESAIALLLGRLILLKEVEIIVVDGGSEDRTVEESLRFTDKVYVSDRQGRAVQMNLGVKYSSGDILLFLHADTFGFTDRHILAIKESLKGEAVGGAFSLKIDSKILLIKIIGFCANIRSRFFGITYGDQSIFLKKETFLDLKGYNDIPVLEDYDLFNRMTKLGRTVILDESVSTSARRWESQGIIKVTIRNIFIITFYLICNLSNRSSYFFRLWENR